MAHTVRDKKKLIDRVRRIRGQVDALERALDSEAECSETLRLLAACRGAINSLMAEVIEGHIRHHVAPHALDPLSPEAKATEELVDVVRAYLK